MPNHYGKRSGKPGSSKNERPRPQGNWTAPHQKNTTGTPVVTEGAGVRETRWGDGGPSVKVFTDKRKDKTP